MINKWNFRTPTDEELHKRDRLAADLGISPVISLLRHYLGGRSQAILQAQFERPARSIPYARHGESGESVEPGIGR